jgi:AcrR family transcriptional regulator
MGRNQETNQKIKMERQERILSGALELFALNGLSGTKISDIAKHTNMSNGLIYHYYPSKEDIYTELIRVAFERLVTACKYLAIMELPPHKKIRYAIDELVKTIRTKPESGLYYLLIAQATASSHVPSKVKDLLKKYRGIPYKTIAGIVAEGQQHGTIRQGSADDLAFFFWVNVNGIALHQVMYGENAKSPLLGPLYHMFFTSEGGE